MKHGSGIKGRDDRSSGIEIRIADALAKINPTDPLILAKQAARRNLNCSDSSLYIVYYESIKREPKIRGIKKCRCDERLKLKQRNSSGISLDRAA
jgi:hypothetical protein